MPWLPDHTAPGGGARHSEVVQSQSYLTPTWYPSDAKILGSGEMPTASMPAIDNSRSGSPSATCGDLDDRTRSASRVGNRTRRAIRRRVVLTTATTSPCGATTTIRYSTSGAMQICISSLDGTARHDWRSFQGSRTRSRARSARCSSCIPRNLGAHGVSRHADRSCGRRGRVSPRPDRPHHRER